jgi:hypothetical protein
MPYWEYVHSYADRHASNKPVMMEIGIDKGKSLVTMFDALQRKHKEFDIYGVDVMIQECVKVHFKGVCSLQQRCHLIEQNSLEYLTGFDKPLDAMFIDGDHNYYTVEKELVHAHRLVRHGGIIVLDDYGGKWSVRDCWYSQRPDYKDNKIATQPQKTEKHGVKLAVDEFYAKHKNEYSKLDAANTYVVTMVKK